MVTKFRSRVDSKIRTEELNAEIEEYNEGQWGTENDKSFTPSKKVFSTPLMISRVDMKLENSPIIIRIKEKSLAKQANILAKLEKRNKKYEDRYSYKKEVWK